MFTPGMPTLVWAQGFGTFLIHEKQQFGRGFSIAHGAMVLLQFDIEALAECSQAVGVLPRIQLAHR